MARPLVAGNWKMNIGPSEAVSLAEELRDGLAGIDSVTRVICPPFVSIAAVSKVLDGSGIGVGAQNAHAEDVGAFTGEVSMAMLPGVCSHVIVGHSERRHLFGETDQLVSEKTAAAQNHGLHPIVCVGESLEIRDSGEALEYVGAQLRASLSGVASSENLVIGYEPVWAIGTGRSARPDTAQEMAGSIRTELAAIYGRASAAEIPILYGGSVNTDNIGPYVDRSDIDGALVGGASLKPGEFVRLTSLTASIRG
jgi:triosephosphate isomerase